MKIRRSFAALAAVMASLFVVATPTVANAWTPPCTYTLDEAAGTVSGVCTLSTYKLTFSGNYDEAAGTASGDFDIVTAYRSIDGSFTATNVGSSAMTVTWTVRTWWKTFTGTFRAYML